MFQKLKGLTVEYWATEVFGIPVIGSKTAKTSGKLAFGASLLAELLDNDNDGCADDPNVLAHLLKKDPAMDPFPETRQAVFMLGMDDEYDSTAFLKLGYTQGQYVNLFECAPGKAGLGADANDFDATQEEWLHFINSFGHANAYPKIFGTMYTSNSALTNAMDIAR